MIRDNKIEGYRKELNFYTRNYIIPKMFINRDELLSSENKITRKKILAILEAGIKSVNPYNCVQNTIKIINNEIIIDDVKYNINSYKNIFIIGAGKASIPMVTAIVDIFSDRAQGFVNSLEDDKIGNIICNKSSHPIPDINGENGAKEIFNIAQNAKANDLILCLISGGGSAMMPLPENGISLENKMEITKILLKCGANIYEINAVRKHLSGIKGGKLSKIAYPAQIISLILSDVVGDPLDSIASGPTAPDSTTFNDVFNILNKYNLEDKLPENIKRYLDLKNNETPKKGDKIFENVRNVIIGNNKKALINSSNKAKELGYNTLLLTSFLEGEAREVGIVLMSLAKEILKYNKPIKKPAMILCGGETTVTLKRDGKGGRNQELILGALRDLPENVTIASIGTDGIDGNSNAAGAIADFDVLKVARIKKLNIDEYLKYNNSNSFFKKTNGQIITGVTGTNVADIMVISIE